MKKFLIINPFGIGDVLFTTPVVRAVKKAYPDSFIGYWCNERVQEILKDNIYINKVFPLARGDLKKIWRRSRIKGIGSFFGLLRSIKNVGFDISLDFSLDHRYSLISKFLGIKRRIGFNYKKRGRFLTDKLDLEGYGNKHVVEYYLDLLNFLGVDRAASGRLDLFITEADKTKSREFLAGFGITGGDLVVGIVPGAGESWGKEAYLKHWPAENFSRLADEVSTKPGIRVLILGDVSEKPIAEKIVNAAKSKIIDLSGKTSLKELSAVISNLDVLVANDGGPLHMAAALGVKTVSIFGPVDEKVYGPYPREVGHIVIKKDVSCRPCYRNFRLSECINNRICIMDVSVEEVSRAVQVLLSDDNR